MPPLARLGACGSAPPTHRRRARWGLARPREQDGGGAATARGALPGLRGKGGQGQAEGQEAALELTPPESACSGSSANGWRRCRLPHPRVGAVGVTAQCHRATPTTKQPAQNGWRYAPRQRRVCLARERALADTRGGDSSLFSLLSSLFSLPVRRIPTPASERLGPALLKT